MTTEEQCREAAFDVLLERTLTERGNHTTARSAEPLPGQRNSRRALTASSIAAGIAVVLSIAWLRGDGHDATAQDPVEASVEQTVTRVDQLREFAPKVRDASAYHVQVVLMDFPIRGMRAQQVDYVKAPEVRIALDDGPQLMSKFADLFAKPSDSSSGMQDALLDLHLSIADDRYVRVRCHRNGHRISISNGSLGLRHVDGELADRLTKLMAEASDLAATSFVFAKTHDDMRNAPDSITQLLAYGVEDEALREVKRMPGLRRVKLVGRGVDEYPQEYDGVSLSATGLAHLATCQRITHLHVESAVLSDQALRTIAGMPALRELVIEDGRRGTFSARGFGMLANLPNLRSVLIERCASLDDAGLEALARSRSLRRVELRECENIGGAGVGALFRLPSLRHLELTEVDIDGVDEMAKSETLQHLELRKCTGRFTNFAQLTKLTDIRLHNVAIDEQTIASLASAPITRVQLSRCAAAMKHLPQVARLTKLEQLIVSNIPEGADWPSIFAALREAKQLRRLILLQNRLTDEDALHLRPLKQLRELDLRVNRISATRGEELRKWLPDTLVRVAVYPK